MASNLASVDLICVRDQAESLAITLGSSGCLPKQMTELTKINLQNPANLKDFSYLSPDPIEMDIKDDLEKDSEDHLEDIDIKSTYVKGDKYISHQIRKSHTR